MEIIQALNRFNQESHIPDLKSFHSQLRKYLLCGDYTMAIKICNNMAKYVSYYQIFNILLEISINIVGPCNLNLMVFLMSESNYDEKFIATAVYLICESYKTLFMEELESWVSEPAPCIRSMKELMFYLSIRDWRLYRPIVDSINRGSDPTVEIAVLLPKWSMIGSVKKFVARCDSEALVLAFYRLVVVAFLCKLETAPCDGKVYYEGRKISRIIKKAKSGWTREGSGMDIYRLDDRFKIQ